MNCNSCGAGTDPNFLTCQFCGAASVTLDPEQELKAVRELADTARRIGAEKQDLMTNLMGQTGTVEGSSKVERIAQLWSNAFIPMTFEAQFQALAQVNGAISSSGRSDHAGKHLANEALIRRGETLVAAMATTSASEPSLAARCAEASTQFRQSKEKAQNLEKAGIKKAKMTIFIAGGFVLLFIIGVVSLIVFGDTKHLDIKCRGESTSCEINCQIAACAELCGEGTQWACMTFDRLGGSNQKGLAPVRID